MSAPLELVAAHVRAAIVVWLRQSGIEAVPAFVETFAREGLLDASELAIFARAVAALFLSSVPKIAPLDPALDSPAVGRLREIAALRALDVDAAEIGVEVFTLAPAILAELDAARDAAQRANARLFERIALESDREAGR